MIQDDKENTDNALPLVDQAKMDEKPLLTNKRPETENKNSIEEKEQKEGEENLMVAKKKNPKEVIVIGGPTGGATDLQSSFLKFRQQKMRERQLMKACQQVDINSQQRSEEYKNALRAKFIEKAKSYIGVPYARRFQDPSTPEAPLYLDCCALVRKCVQDLSEEFGFIIGRWNQAYQMDTLPIILEESELKAGDLIFYEGTYNSKRSKPQKHNNVHVEIFLGGETGEATIGSRFFKGTVSIFPSYKFTSTSWTLVKHHFRSIDTWLNGVCKSCCPDHAWASDSLAYLEAAGKRSIFSDEHESRKRQEEDEEDVRADNEEEEEDNKSDEAIDRVDGHKEQENIDDDHYHNNMDDEDEEGGGDGTEPSSDEELVSNQRNLLATPKQSSSEPLTFPAVVTRNKSKSMNDADQSLLPDPSLFSVAVPSNTTKYDDELNTSNRMNDDTNGDLSKSLDSSLNESCESMKLSVNNSSLLSKASLRRVPSKRDNPAGAATNNNTSIRTNRRVLSKSLDNERDLILPTASVSTSMKKSTGSPTRRVEKQQLSPDRKSGRDGVEIVGEGVFKEQKFKPVTKRISKYATNSASQQDIAITTTTGEQLSSERLNPTKSSRRGIVSNTASSEEVSETITVPLHKTYYVSKSNGWRLVKAALDRRGWQQLPFDYQFTSKFGLKWVERRSQIDYRGHQAGQLVCHIPNNDIMTTKTGLLTIMRDKFCSKSLPVAQRKAYPPWLPLTFELESPADVTALFDYLRNHATTTGGEVEGKQLIWIYKPACNNRGRGIRVVAGEESLREICYGKPAVIAASSSSSNINSSSNTIKEVVLEPAIEPLKGIIQKYIENPLLMYLSPTDLTKGYKFDIRCYLFIARNYPTTFAFYHPGYCRLALHPYSREELNDPFMHLTNASVQKKDTDHYQQNKDIQIQSVAAMAENMAQTGRTASHEYILQRLDHEIKLCMVDVMKACNNKLLKKHGYFDLLGCDFMITDDNQLYLLEINTNPALSLDNHVLQDLLPRVVDGALELVLRSQGSEVKDLASVSFHPQDELPSQYQLLFDEKTQWVYT